MKSILYFFIKYYMHCIFIVTFYTLKIFSNDIYIYKYLIYISADTLLSDRLVSGFGFLRVESLNLAPAINILKGFSTSITSNLLNFHFLDCVCYKTKM